MGLALLEKSISTEFNQKLEPKVTLFSSPEDDLLEPFTSCERNTSEVLHQFFTLLLDDLRIGSRFYLLFFDLKLEHFFFELVFLFNQSFIILLMVLFEFLELLFLLFPLILQ